MDIFEYAMKLEKDGEDYYRQMAEKADNQGLKTILGMLADEEVKHYNIVQRLSEENPQMPETTVLEDAKNVFIQMKDAAGGFDLDSEQPEIYKKAQDIEQKTRDFYLEKADHVEKASRKEVLLNLAEEEKKHYFLLDNIIEFALYSGHGEFPRVIFAPGKIEDGFYLTQKAFNLADKYQIPVIVMTDQYFMDSYYNIERLDLSQIKVEKHITETEADYKRYQLTEGGISPRGVPGFGKGTVVADSDEHDEEGHITEDLDLRTRMVDKRLKKMESIRGEAISPELIGAEEYKTLVICWGSTYNVVKEALEGLKREDVSLLHFSQVHPLHNDTADYLKKAGRTIIVENNATSQFSRLLKLHAGMDVDHKILKYDGLSFSVKETRERLKALLA